MTITCEKFLEFLKTSCAVVIWPGPFSFPGKKSIHRTDADPQAVFPAVKAI
ncbi:MAG: hypothetical protein WBV94_18760 [Blastocatellia bacterium]